MSNKIVVEQAENEHGSLNSVWTDISQRETNLNWFAAEITPPNRGEKVLGVEVSGKGEGGLLECAEFLGNSPGKILFGLLRVSANDQSNSSRQKFIYFRFLGSDVSPVKKGKVTPNMGLLDDLFPVKHLTLDLDSQLSGFELEPLAREFLRVGGAHKPDSYDFGPEQEFRCD
jgi:hypothetical protein